MKNKAGRPFKFESEDTPLQVISVRLSTYHKALAKRYGGGSITEGIRAALDAMMPTKRMA